MLSALLLIVVINAMGHTYAKYISGDKGSGKAEIAKWSFEIAKNGEQSKNIQLADTVKKTSLVEGKIAPGTNGEILFTLDATGSEVDLEYTVYFENEESKPDNIIFTYMGVDYQYISEIPEIKGKIFAENSNKTKEIKILWRWDYERGFTPEQIAANDKIDTQTANTITEYTFDIIATGTQSK